MSKKPLRIIPVSMDSKWADAEANCQAIESRIKSDEIAEGSVFVFPELTLTGFVLDEPEKSALALDAEVIQKIKALAKAQKCAIVFGFIEQNLSQPTRPYNALLMVGPEGQVLAHYRKNHLFTLGQPCEAYLYSPGPSLVVTEFQGWRLGFAICFDLRFPEMYQHYRKMGVEAIILPACWVDGPHKEYQFKTLSSAQAILSHAYFVSVNRSGEDKSFKYSGSHYAFASTGESLTLDVRGAYLLSPRTKS